MLERTIREFEEMVRREALLQGRQLGREEGRKEGLEEGRKEGREEGRKEGRKEGREEEKRNIALKLLARGMTPEQVSDLVDLPVEEVRKLIH